MTVPRLTAVRLGGAPDLPLLVLGPSLGTSSQALWSAAGRSLAADYELLAWDLPGHGSNTYSCEPFEIHELAAAVLGLVDDMLAERGRPGASFHYAGVSLGGAVGLQLLLDAPTRIDAAVLLCTGAKIGEPLDWAQRSATVRENGTPAVVEGSGERWFAPGFADREPDVAGGLLRALSGVLDGGYAESCDALARFDVRDRLGRIRTPVLAVAGADDVATPPENLGEIAARVRNGRSVVLPGTAHLAPVERPVEVAGLILGHLRGEQPPADLEAAPAPPEPEPVPEPTPPESPASPPPPAPADPAYVAGNDVRREVLGDEHVNRSIGAATDFTRDFQELITRYAWGTVWTRPGLDRRSRSMITLTALVAGGHHEELALHVRAARRNGLSTEEIKEVLLAAAIYCGVPAANTAFRIAQGVLEEETNDD